MPKYPDLLDLPTAHAVATIAEALLDAAGEGWARLEDPADAEALHDFRVALRRLRSVLRAFGRHLEPQIPGKLRRRLRDLARATNAARDSEVQIVWARARWEHLTRRERVGARWYVTHLEERREGGYDASRAAIESDFPKLEARLRKRLARILESGAGKPPAHSFGGAAADLVREHTAALHAQLPTIVAPGDEAEVHLARIEAKRLRYVLELLEGEAKSAARAVQRLKGLQTLLGDLHDAQVIERHLEESLSAAAAEHARRVLDVEVRSDASEADRRATLRRNAVPGVVALARLAREARDDLFETFVTEWREEALTPLERDLEAVVQTCQDHAGLPVEIERKYLLSELPERIGQAPSVVIEQGWLPGTKLMERLRRTTSEHGEEFYRTVKLGSGLTRVELEETTPPEVFESLWPLTEGRRVRKRRYTVSEEGLAWEIDEFLDRNLVLAEVELPHAALKPELPAWLGPAVVREVTGEAAYVNLNLAK